jgi:predicted cobalt transporter CbtA
VDTDRAVYITSAAEMDRRLRAYTTFIVSLLAGIALSSIDYLFRAPAIWLACLAGLALVLALSRLAFIRSFRSYSQIELRLNGSYVERTRGPSFEKYPLADITGLRTKRTSRKCIREITARFSNGRRFSVNGVAGFERLEQELRSKVPANATVTETREPIDYDHSLFYVVFGGLVGLTFTLAVRAMSSLSEGGLRWTTLGIAGYSIVLGAFLLIARPIAQRYGPKSRSGDYLFGLLAVLAGIVLALRSLTAFGR